MKKLLSTTAVITMLFSVENSYASVFSDGIKQADESLYFGNYSQAYSDLKNLLDNKNLAPNEVPQVALKLAEAYLSVGDFVNARKYGIFAIKQNPDLVTKKKIKKLLAGIKKKLKTHQIGGKFSASYGTFNNAGVAPAAAMGQDIVSDYGEDFGDETSDEEDDVVDEDIFDDQDIEEVEAGDADSDGIDDLIDEDIDDDLLPEAFFGKNGDSDNRYDTRLGFDYSYVLSEAGHYWKTSFQAAGSFFEDRDNMNKKNYVVTTGPVFNFSEYRLKINPTISYVTLDRDDDRFLDSWIASITAMYKASSNMDISLRYNSEDRDIVSPTAPDTNVNGLTLGINYKLTPKDLVKLSISPKVDDFTNVTRNKDGITYRAGYFRKLPWSLTAGLNTAYSESDYVNLANNRQDSQHKYGAIIGKTFKGGYSLSLAVEDQFRRSNTLGKDSRGQSFIVTTGYKF